MSSSNSHIEALTPNIVEFGDGAFGSYLVLDETTRLVFHDGISDLMRRNTRELALFVPLPCEDTPRRWPSMTERGLSPETDQARPLILDFKPLALGK